MFRKHHQKWFSLSFRYVRHLDDSQYVVQSTFIKLLEKEFDKSVRDVKKYIGALLLIDSLMKAIKIKEPLL